MRLASKRSLRLPSCCSVDVVNGGAGERVKGFSSAESTLKGLPCNADRSAAARGAVTSTASPRESWPVSGSKSLPDATRRPSSATRRASKDLCSFVWNVATRSQYSAERNRIRARSRSTSILIATLCTRPADSRGPILRQSTGETS